jgi:predicted ATPase/signal transduction histidine kinase/GAF domain-containing protein
VRDLIGYVLEPLRLGSEYILYRGRQTGNAAPILVLASAATSQSPANLARMVHEYELASQLDPEWAVRPIALAHHDGHTVLAFDDPGGGPLDRLIGKPLAISEFLRTAISIADALRQVHDQGLIHRDINPSNILFDRSCGRVWLTGFGIASRLPRERQDPKPPEEIAGTLAYVAPEQTGRMNRSIDSRSDLYAMGVTFYAMLTGTHPFRAGDPMEWIHCHIARVPVAPSERVSSVPTQLSAIVMRLLAKTAEDRYQTAAGVLADLRRCLIEMESVGRIETFPLGALDTSDRLLIPELLYGRESEIAALVASFGRVVATGTPELVLVSGYSGVGKSSVVNELHRVLVPPRGLFASGKFDQYKRDIPYATLAQAFRSLVRQILVKNAAEVEQWRSALAGALAANGQLIVNLVPELEFVIGKQPPVADLPTRDAQNRFQMIFRRFLGVFARKEHPLALFLDDLQWLDSATLDFLEHLITHPEVRHLLLVGAYRDNEVGPSHPLMRTLEVIRKTDAGVHEIVLAPLGLGDVGRLIADGLHCELERAQPLAELVRDKTGGNPFFAIQFLTGLTDEGLLAFDRVASAWAWDMDRIRAKSYTDNVVDLVAAKLKRLSATTQEALKQLACLGNVAEITTVTLAQGTAEEAISATLREAVHAGLVLRQGGAYKFLHDRIQQAAYSLIPEDHRAEAHLSIGRRLLASLPEDGIAEYLFDIANQLNRGGVLLIHRDDKAGVAAIDLRAGRKAKASAAYESARKYFSAGMALLNDEDWGNQYDLMFRLWLERAECEFLTGHFDTAKQLIGELLQRAASKVDQAAVYNLQIRLHEVNGEYAEALACGLECLSLFGIDIPAHPTQEQVAAEYETVWQVLDGRPIESMIDLPLMTDSEIQAAMQVLSGLTPPAFFTDPRLAWLQLCRMVKIGIWYGTSGALALAFGYFGNILGPVFHRYTDGYRFVKLASDLVEKHGFIACQAKIYYFMAHVIPWTHPIANAIPFMRATFRTAIETGDLAFACYGLLHPTEVFFLRNDSLDMVWRESEIALDFARQMKYRDVADLIQSQQRFIATMQGRTETFCTFNDAQFDEATFEARLTKDRMSLLIFWYWTLKLKARFLAGEYAEALDAADKAKSQLSSSPATILMLDYVYYSALTLAACYESASTDQRQAWCRLLAAQQEQLREWVENYPPTFADKHVLVLAEIARLEGRDLDAMRLYEQAIRSAHENGFIQNEGLAYEVAARFYTARGFEAFSKAYLQNARSCYLRWGAEGKVRQMDLKYPNWTPQLETLGSDRTIGTPADRWDLTTVVKVSQAVSGEIHFDRLIDVLMETALENAGAERGLLILPRGEEMWIEAEAATAEDHVVVYRPNTRVTPAGLPESVYHFVIRTRDSVLLDDASKQEPFSADTYVRSHNSRSIMCLPLIKQTKLIGVLYLENSLASHVFTPARIAVLSLLASQAATSLENARLYSDLQEADAYLAEAQRLSHTGSFKWGGMDGAISWSEEVYRIYGFDRTSELSLERIFQNVHPDDVDSVRDLAEKMSTKNDDFELEHRIVMADGSIKYLRIVAHAVLGEAGGRKVIGAVMDVTSFKEALDRLRKAQADLAHAARLTTLGELAASIAHEVNQPLMAIVTNAESCLLWLTMERPNWEKAREAAERIVKNGHRAGDVVKSIRALVRKSDAEIVALDINQVIGDTLDLMQSELRRRGVSLETRLTSSFELIKGDRTQLQQVIVNLIMNAIEAMDTVPTSARILRVVSEFDEKGDVFTSIEDTGPGIETELLERIFDPMFTTKPTGLGLGLSICHSIIDGHAGRLWVVPNPIGGSIFRFSLPSINGVSHDATT